MAKIIYGDRIGKTSKLAAGCSATIFDESRTKVLITRRTDNGRWCLPGGRMEAGESAAETIVREVEEETGLRIRVRRLIGIYTSPHRIIEYPDGNHWQFVSMNFEAEMVGGEPRLSDEATEVGFFSFAEMGVMETHLERIVDAFARQEAAFVR